MKLIDPNIKCPSCQNSLRAAAFVCDACELKVEGHFALNEFARLSADDLHFLRTFVNCEGRIRDMEPALGLSYPTIRARLTAFKEKLSSLAAAQATPPISSESPKVNELPKETPPPSSKASQILTRLNAGEITYDEALLQLKAAGEETSRKSKKEKK